MFCNTHTRKKKIFKKLCFLVTNVYLIMSHGTLICLLSTWPFVEYLNYMCLSGKRVAPRMHKCNGGCKRSSKVDVFKNNILLSYHQKRNMTTTTTCTFTPRGDLNDVWGFVTLLMAFSSNCFKQYLDTYFCRKFRSMSNYYNKRQYYTKDNKTIKSFDTYLLVYLA